MMIITPQSHETTRRYHRGSVVLQMVGVILVILAVSTLIVDIAVVYAVERKLQTAADAGVLAATRELFISTSTDPLIRQADGRTLAANLVSTYSSDNFLIAIDPNADVEYGFVDPAAPVYDAATFTTPSTDEDYVPTGGYNAARVVVRKTSDSTAGDFTSLLGNVLGISRLFAQTEAVAIMDRTIISVSEGLRPFYSCDLQLEAALADGDMTNDVIQVFGDELSYNGDAIGCPPPPNGNWGFADFEDGGSGAPSIPTVVRWILEGYGSATGEEPVYADEDYSTQPGDALCAAPVKKALQSLIDNETPVMVPIISSETGTGSNTAAHIVNFAGFIFTEYSCKGPADSRYVLGRFTHTICASNCGTGNEVGGTTFKLRLIQ